MAGQGLRRPGAKLGAAGGARKAHAQSWWVASKMPNDTALPASHLCMVSSRGGTKRILWNENV